MPIELTVEINETGLEANYWVLMDYHVTRGKTSVTDTLTGSFQLFKSAADFATKRHISGMYASVSIVGNVQSSHTVAQLINALENEIIKTGEALEGGTKV